MFLIIVLFWVFLNMIGVIKGKIFVNIENDLKRNENCFELVRVVVIVLVRRI